MELVSMFIAAVLINNIVLTKFLGMCPFLGVSKKMSSAVGMGVAVIFVIFGASLISYALYYLVLVPLHLEYMQLITFILVIASFVQFVEMVIKKYSPSLYKALGVYLPLITTNCTVLYVAQQNRAERAVGSHSREGDRRIVYLDSIQFATSCHKVVDMQIGKIARRFCVFLV